VSAAQRIAVVTGGNRGIGFEICRQLAKAGCTVVLTARDARKGRAACGRLEAQGLAVEFHQLDVTNAKDIAALTAYLKSKFGGVDILVNNAGIASDPRGSRLADCDLATVREVFETNTLAPLALIQALVPLMKKRGYGRIVNITSGMGQLSDMGSGSPAYRISKTALNAVTRMAATETRGANILVNSMCPGWVKTDMGGSGAPRTVEQGADTALWLATLPDGGPTGGLFRDRKPIVW